MTNQQAAHRL